MICLPVTLLCLWTEVATAQGPACPIGQIAYPICKTATCSWPPGTDDVNVDWFCATLATQTIVSDTAINWTAEPRPPTQLDRIEGMLKAICDAPGSKLECPK